LIKGIDQFLGCFADQLNVRSSGQATLSPQVERKKNKTVSLPT
jgi:hypothetical protein